MTVTAGIYHWLVHGDGYQILSGPIVILSVWGWAGGWWRHHNCHQHHCWRIGHRHPGHGRPVCSTHYHRAFTPKPRGRRRLRRDSRRRGRPNHPR